MSPRPPSSLELNDLLAPDSTIGEVAVATRDPNPNYKGKKKNNKEKTKKTFPNPNKFLYSTSSFAACYDATADPRKKIKDNNSRSSELQPGEEELISNEEHGIPLRYRLTIRPPFYKVSNFDYTAYNDTGVWVGWDYAPSFANSFACSVLALLYFVGEMGEMREMALELQLCGSEMEMMMQVGKLGGRETSECCFPWKRR